MMEQLNFYNKIIFLPEEIKREVNDFIDFLISKRKSEIKKKKPQYGCAKGKIFMSSDFDEPLEDFKDYM